jgi:predicted DNA-binding transcriptional regulator AlpA
LKTKTHRREDRFLSREELGARWGLSRTELVNREKAGLLRPYKLSYKVVRYRLSDILRIEEKAAK